MPFVPTETPPSMNAKVTVKFAGLLLLKPGADDSCEVGIHRLSNTHSFQAMVIVSKPNRPPSLIRMVTGPLTRPFAINVTPAPNTGVRAFNSDPFSRRNGGKKLDFRWALDMQTMQGQDVDFNAGARPVATLSTGTLYTSNLTHKELNPELVRGTIRRRLHRFSADLAAAIDLTSYRSRVELTWDEGGEMRELRLPRRVDRHEPKTTYTVVLLNDPPLTNTAAHDELDYYYEVLEHAGVSIASSDRYHMSFNTGPTTDEIPCMPVIINQ